MGWENIFNCEIDPFCQRILKYHFPNAKQHTDIKQTDFSIYRGRIDVISGGFPCQPVSNAGKRKGTTDDRFLWPEMFRAIQEIQPTWILAENVRGITSQEKGMVFEQVCLDMENEGYEVQPFIIPACGVNSPHERYRVWFIAYSHRNDARRSGYDEVRCTQRKNKEKQKEREWFRTNPERIGKKRITSDPTSKGLQGHFNCREQEIKRGENSTWNNPSRFYTTENWENFPTQSPVCGRNDGFPDIVDIVALLERRKAREPYIRFGRWKKESIKAYGNAIVWIIAFKIFQSIEEINEILK